MILLLFFLQNLSLTIALENTVHLYTTFDCPYPGYDLDQVKHDDHGTGLVYKAKLSKKTLILYGSLNEYNHNSDITGYLYPHKRKFKLSKNLKIIGSDDGGSFKFSRKEFKQFIKQVNNRNLSIGIHLYFKNNKLYKIHMCP